VPAESSDSGAVLLAKRAKLLGTAAPRFNSSGLLCAIDGYPTDGCGEQTGSKYAYWSYWHGAGGAWSYSTVGPGGSRVHASSVEGWRFQPEGAGNPSDPPPRGSADPAATCVPDRPASTTSASASDSESGGAIVTTSVGSGSRAPSETSSTSEVAATVGAADAPSSVGSATSASAAPARTEQQAAGPLRVTERKRSTPVWGVAAVGGLIAALGVGGAVVARRRRATEP
jgi:hypothetical protein